MSKSRCQQSWFPLEGLKFGASPSFWWLLATLDCPWWAQHWLLHFDLCLCLHMAFFPLEVCVFSFTVPVYEKIHYGT